jgi:phage/plasmid primase-like uncharacterized protein
MAAEGIVTDDPIMADGKIHRIHVKGDRKGKRNGWYVLHLNNIPAGAFGSWRFGIKKTWRFSAPGVTTDASSRERVAEAAKQRAEEEAREHERARLKAHRIWTRAKPAQADHPYLTKKKVKPHSLRMSWSRLVVPIQDASGSLWSLQFINRDGEKIFLGGGRVSGCFYLLGNPKGKLLIAEGYATGATVREATGQAVAVAFDCGNLTPVAKALRQKFPDTEMVICADDDRTTTGNPGLTKAREAARAVRAKLAVPHFRDGQPGTDFNDLACFEGLEAVRTQLAAASALGAEAKQSGVADVASQGQGVGANPQDSDTSGETSMAESREPQVVQLLNLIKDFTEGGGLGLFHNELHEPFARVRIGGHFENIAIRDRTFHEWLTRFTYTRTGKVFNQQAFAGAKDVLCARAKFDGPKHRLYNRVARLDGSIWYDLTDLDWRAVRITAEGWTVENKPPILFRRFAHQCPQVEPERGGNVDSVLSLFNLADLEAKRLLATAVVSFFVPEIPHPIPALYGEHGSAKSTLARFVRAWVDPSQTPTMGEPDQDEIIQALAHNYVLPLDNLRSIEPWLSDILCRAVTGEGFTKRRLYTDEGDVIFAFRRCVLVNGINSLPRRADLLDRSILFELPDIPRGERREEEDITARFGAELPFVLGATFDVLSNAMRIREGLTLTDAPRMADFARWGEAIWQAAGWGTRTFLASYEREEAVRNEAAIEASPVALALRAFVEEQSCGWEGTAGELLAELTRVASRLRIETRAREWPKQPNVLSRRLNEIMPNLRRVGIRITHGWREKSKTIIVDISGIEGSPSKVSTYAPTKTDDTGDTDAVLSRTKVKEPF